MAGNHRMGHALRVAVAAANGIGGVSTLSAQQPPVPAAAASALEEVIVTGSRLPTPNEVSVSPISSIAAADIQQTGLTRVEDVLDTLPMVFPSLNSTNNFGADGTAAVNLRGLGVQRTLVLLDGVRLGPGSTDGRNWSDLNQIPAALVERVDVLTGGASAVYGADAVAGVVNVIINTHFEGVKVEAGYHFNHHSNDDPYGLVPLLNAAGDTVPPSTVTTGTGKNAAVIMGTNFASSRGNVSGYVTYDDQSAALQSEFDYSACALVASGNQMLACGGSHASRGGEFFAFSNSGVLVDNTVDPQTGEFRPFEEPRDTYNYAAVSYFQTPNERWTAGAFLNYEFNQHATVYTTAMYMRNSMTAQGAPTAAFGVYAFIPCADPLLTAQEVATLCTPTNIAANGGNYEVYNGTNYPGLVMQIWRRNVEGGNRIFTFVNNAARGVLGVKGGLADGWAYNVYAQHSRVNINNDAENDLSVPQIQEALNVLPGLHGPVCGGQDPAGTAFLPNSKCVPWNIWVPNAVAPASLAFMSIPLYTLGSVTEQVASASVTGDLTRHGAKLPAAENGLQLNMGAEWRKEQSSYVPNYELQQGFAASAGVVPPVGGDFTVKEVFSELRLPLASHRTLADDLSVEGGYRYSRYGTGFDTHTYKLGLQWAPLADVRLRGSYQRAVRAPNITELFSLQSLGADGTLDPCAGTPTASLAACELTGVKPNQYGHILPSPFSSYNGLTGGNTSLRPEVADTYTAGVVLQPRIAENLTLSLDYFNIKIDGVIAKTGADTIMLDCLGSVGNPAQAERFCPLIHRDPEGSLWLTNSGYITDVLVNEGGLATRGFDINGSYRVLVPTAGSLSFALVGTYLQSLQTTPVAGRGSYDCVGLFGSTCGVPAPKWRHVVNAIWSPAPRHPLQVNLRWRYIGSVDSEQTSVNPFLSGTPYLPLAHIHAYSYFDLTGIINLGKSVTLQLGVNNIADKAPPLFFTTDCLGVALGVCNGNTFPGLYDALGRYVFAQVSAQL